jgi:hypothetical protein
MAVPACVKDPVADSGGPVAPTKGGATVAISHTYCAEREELAAQVQFPAESLLRGHVGHGAHQFFQDVMVGNVAAYLGRSIWHRRCIVRQRLNTGKPRATACLHGCIAEMELQVQ